MITHRTLEGGWAVCPAPDVCELRFHFPDQTPAEMAAMPDAMLWALLEVVDPPTRTDADVLLPRVRELAGADLVVKAWEEGDLPVGRRYHRAYGLPALVRVDGRVEYWEHGWQVRR